MNTKTKKPPRISYGDVDVPDEAFRPENVRRRISIMIPEDVLALVQSMAREAGLPYQTFINQLLREAVSGDSIAARLNRIEKALATRPRSKVTRRKSA
jgi:uncharacterized protein (DUF4415 family)